MDNTTMFPPRVCYRGQPDFPIHFTQALHMSSIKPAPRQRRNRTHFREWQLDILEKTYLKTNYIDVEQREILSHDLNLSDSNIKIWFQNRRSKTRREEKQEPTMPSPKPTTEDTHRLIMAVRRDRKKTASRIPPPPLALPSRVDDAYRPRTLATGCCYCPGPYLPGPLQLPYLPLSSFPWSPAFSPGSSPGFTGMFQFPPLPLIFPSSSRSIDGSTGGCADLKSYEQR